MSSEILKGLKYTLLAQLLIFVIFGIFFTFFIDFYVQLFNWPNLDPTAGRFIGVIFLSFAFVLFLVYRESDFEKIELIIILDVLIMILGAIVQLVGVFLDGTDWAGWFNFALQISFFVGLLYFYILQVRG
ncbi:MAG: hypothetical protein JSV62_05760 [Promethearchaeota archaeon]|nr:MAG: hypothetical protein JSV62_05760 [Candidatus Lokiarchaeota archaeon]